MPRRWLWWGAVAALLAVASFLTWRTLRGGHRFDRVIRDAAVRHKVDPALVKAVVWRESGFDPAARGKAGEIGLMQLRELAAIEWAGAERIRGFEFEHLLDPTTNTMAGAWYLGRLLRRYSHLENPEPYALADYNAGRNNVLKWAKGPGATNAVVFMEQVGFPGTKRYIQTVLQRRKRYAADF